MPNHFIPATPQHTQAMDLFPELAMEIDRRISYSEQRIKNWVLVGILTNFAMITLAAVPAVFYLGQLSHDAADALVRIQSTRNDIDAIQRDGESRKFGLIQWQTSVELYLTQHGWRPPRDAH